MNEALRYYLITPQLYSPLYLLILEVEGLVTSSLSLSLASLSRLSLSPEPNPQRLQDSGVDEALRYYAVHAFAQKPPCAAV